MYCRKCGCKMPNDSIFCGKCGCKTVLLPNNNSVGTCIRSKNRSKSRKLVFLSSFIVLAFVVVLGYKLLFTANDNEILSSELNNKNTVIQSSVLQSSIQSETSFSANEYKSTEERLNALLNDDTPANAKSKAAVDELRTTGKTTLHGKTYTMPGFEDESGSNSIEGIQPLPETGTIFQGQDISRESELTIKSSSNNSCFIKIKNRYNACVFSFFVRAGESITMKVPAGTYQVFFAYGDDWYGTSICFGEKTVYAKDKDFLDFENYTWEYTLYPVTNGNFQETTISKNEF